jgi:hypothetical protein
MHGRASSIIYGCRKRVDVGQTRGIPTSERVIEHPNRVQIASGASIGSEQHAEIASPATGSVVSPMSPEHPERLPGNWWVDEQRHPALLGKPHLIHPELETIEPAVELA